MYGAALFRRRPWASSWRSASGGTRSAGCSSPWASPCRWVPPASHALEHGVVGGDAGTVAGLAWWRGRRASSPGRARRGGLHLTPTGRPLSRRWGYALAVTAAAGRSPWRPRRSRTRSSTRRTPPCTIRGRCRRSAARGRRGAVGIAVTMLGRRGRGLARRALPALAGAGAPAAAVDGADRGAPARARRRLARRHRGPARAARWRPGGSSPSSLSRRAVGAAVPPLRRRPRPEPATTYALSSLGWPAGTSASWRRRRTLAGLVDDSVVPSPSRPPPPSSSRTGVSTLQTRSTSASTVVATTPTSSCVSTSAHRRRPAASKPRCLSAARPHVQHRLLDRGPEPMGDRCRPPGHDRGRRHRGRAQRRAVARIRVEQATVDTGSPSSWPPRRYPSSTTCGCAPRSPSSSRMSVSRGAHRRRAGPERHRIERNLHDGAQQRLLALALQLRASQLRDGDTGEPRDRALVDHAVDEICTAIRELRSSPTGSTRRC